MSKIRVVSFDLEGTLVKPTFSQLVWETEIPKLYAEEEGVSFEEAQEYVRAEYLKVGEERREWYDIKYWFRHFKLNSDWRELLEAHKDAVAVYPEVLDVLEALEGEYTLIVITNTSREFISYLVKPVERYLDQVFSATSDFNSVKKDPQLYREICGRLRVKPVQVAHVGDHYVFDFKVPRVIGIFAFYLDRSRVYSTTNVVRDLSEFQKQLRSI